MRQGKTTRRRLAPARKANPPPRKKECRGVENKKWRIQDSNLCPFYRRKRHFWEEGNAPSDALTVDDPQLQLLIDAWPTLSKAVQQQIMLLVG